MDSLLDIINRMLCSYKFELCVQLLRDGDWARGMLEVQVSGYGVIPRDIALPIGPGVNEEGKGPLPGHEDPHSCQVEPIVVALHWHQILSPDSSKNNVRHQGNQRTELYKESQDNEELESIYPQVSPASHVLDVNQECQEGKDSTS